MADAGPTALLSNIIELDQQGFERTIRTKDKIVVVEFYLPDCPVCKEMAPVYEELSRELAEQAVFAKVDAARNMDLTLQYGVIGTPTFKLFCKDQFIGEIVGETNATVLRNTIKDMVRHQAACASGRKQVFELDGYG